MFVHTPQKLTHADRFLSKYANMHCKDGCSSFLLTISYDLKCYVTYCVTLPIFCVCLFLSDWKFLLVPSSWMANYVLCQRRRSVEGRRRKRGEKQTLCKRSQLVLTYSQDLSLSFHVPSIVVRLLIIVFCCCKTILKLFCFPEFRMEAVIERFRRLHPDVAQVVYFSQSLTIFPFFSPSLKL